MSMRMELSDLPPKYRAQAEAQIAARCRAKAPTLEAVAAAAKKTGREFDSRGEYDYYMGMILPKVQRGEIVKVESHRRFTMLPEKRIRQCETTGDALYPRFCADLCRWHS